MQCDVSNIENPVKRAIQKYKNHPSIEKIKEIFGDNNIFSFDLVVLGTIFKEILYLESFKPTRSNVVPTKIVNANVDLFALYLSKAYS